MGMQVSISACCDIRRDELEKNQARDLLLHGNQIRLHAPAGALPFASLRIADIRSLILGR